MNLSIPDLTKIVKGTKLDLRGWRLGPEGAAQLAADPILAQVEVLDLTGNQVGDAGLDALRSSPHRGTWTALRLEGCRLTAHALRALAADPTVSTVTELQLARNDLGTDAIAALAPLLPRLELLGLAHNPLGDAGVLPLAAARLNAEEVNLTAIGLSAVGLRALVASGGLDKAHHLPLAQNPLGDAGADALARLAATTDGFSSIDLGWTGLIPTGLARLLDSGLFDKGIGHLGLGGNRLGDRGLRLLAEHPKLPRTTLHVDGPGVDPALTDRALIVALRQRTRVIVAEPLDDGEILACAYCAEPLDLSRALCPHCEGDASNDAPTVESREDYEDARRRPCQHCGYRMRAGTTSRCPGCKSWVASDNALARYGR